MINVFHIISFQGIFVTRVQPEGPASKVLQPGDKIIQVFCCLYKIPQSSFVIKVYWDFSPC